MQLEARWSELAVRGVTFPAYRVRPPVAEPLPLVLLVHEVWGVDPHIRDVAGRLAAAGYEVLAPDLWSAGGARPPALTRARVDEARAFLVGLRPGAWADDEARREAVERLPEPARGRLDETLRALFGTSEAERQQFVERGAEVAAEVLRAHAPAGAPSAALGFCVGAAIAATAACDAPGLAGAVLFYGPPPAEERLSGLRCPLLGFYGEKDVRITARVPPFAAALARLGKRFEHHVFPGARHAFFNDTGRGYQVRAARAAWARTLGFLHEVTR